MTSMKLLILLAGLVIASNVLYHVSQKSIPAPSGRSASLPGASVRGQRRRRRAVFGGTRAGHAEIAVRGT